ncbi:MerR family transcriptional regulator [Rhizobium tubonense]|uniref:MerR family transcriptional regulator n=1 Tax=Rhizobium tubonense TaxID=484088 RepID=A0A2W4CUM7_9HYPH|nr:MerR family transcriptional regulator [Rhizobium tubonense]PZM14005.1 MerR family transcriptional regulator [Rhizobium tubonense]
MSYSAQFLSPSKAAVQLGISMKALRLYEQHGLIQPVRTAAGWRTYGPAEMAKAGEIVALRELGLSLAQAALVLSSDAERLEPALAVHQAALEGQLRQLANTVEKVRIARTDLSAGRAPAAIRELARPIRPTSETGIAFDLPWPWGGERFEVFDIRPVNYIIGPLGSGKTRLAHALAEALPDTAFIGLERLADGGRECLAWLDADPALKSRVDQTLALLVEDGATASSALAALLTAMEAETASILVVDMVEQGLDRASQEALGSYLRRRRLGNRPLFLLTRSCSILDLAAVTSDQAIILCPANHSPPCRVAPYPGAPGYEAVATCLASPEVRARTEGMIAWRPNQHTAPQSPP